MRQTTHNRLKRQQDRLIAKPNSVIIYDPATGEPLTPVDPRLYEGNSVVIWIPHNGRDDIYGTTDTPTD